MTTIEIILCVLFALFASFSIHVWVTGKMPSFKGLTSEPELEDDGTWCDVYKSKRRPDMPATRQWVEGVINAKTANCVTPAGETIKRLEARIEDSLPHYYLLLGEDSKGNKIGRLFEGKRCGIAMTLPFKYMALVPSVLTEDELREYSSWSRGADEAWEQGVWNNTEEHSPKGVTREELKLADGMRILLWATANGQFRNPS